MNKYAKLAISHWQHTDPDRYVQIPDPEAFFTQLGGRAQIEIQQLQDALAGPDRPGESYLEKVGRLNIARLSAEEQVLAETILISGPQARAGRAAGGQRARGLAARDDAQAGEVTSRGEVARAVSARFCADVGRAAGARARAQTNLQALRLVRALEREQRQASAEKLRAPDCLKRGWGRCRSCLTSSARSARALARMTINAHHTDPAPRCSPRSSSGPTANRPPARSTGSPSAQPPACRSSCPPPPPCRLNQRAPLMGQARQPTAPRQRQTILSARPLYAPRSLLLKRAGGGCQAPSG